MRARITRPTFRTSPTSSRSEVAYHRRETRRDFLDSLNLPNTTSSATYNVYGKSSSSATLTTLACGLTATMYLEEIMAANERENRLAIIAESSLARAPSPHADKNSGEEESENLPTIE